MKNIQNIVIGVLSLAVVGLYIMQFQSNEKVPEKEVIQEESEVKEEVKPEFNPEVLVQNNGANTGKILWVNVDDINTKYERFDDMERKLNQLRTKYKKELQTKQSTAQSKYEDMQMLYQKGMLTQETAQIREQELGETQQELVMLEQKGATELAQLTEGLNKQIYKDISDFLEKYSTKMQCDYILGYTLGSPFVLYVNDSLDITEEVISGLNSEYATSKKK